MDAVGTSCGRCRDAVKTLCARCDWQFEKFHGDPKLADSFSERCTHNVASPFSVTWAYYSCKYSEEIQSMHFGASQRQVSLHTGVLYTKDNTDSFCSLSDNLKHGPAGICAHLIPVLQ